MRSHQLYKKSNSNVNNTKGPFFSPHAIFPKLTINQPGDQYEREADAMAERVMAMQDNPTPTASSEDEKEQGIIQTKLLPISFIQRKCTECEKEDGMLQHQAESTSALQVTEPESEVDEETVDEEEETTQTKPDILRQEDEEEMEEAVMAKAEGRGMTASPGLQSRLQSSKGGGVPLPARTNRFMNNAFGSDFSHVRVHTGQQANEMNQGIRAKAFTHGSDIYFRRGQYNPNSSGGKKLLAHELTHVVQQKNSKNYLQRVPFGTESLHEDLTRRYSQEMGVPYSPGLQYSEGYRQWLAASAAARRAFDSHMLLPSHLTNPYVLQRLNRMSVDELYTYRETYITQGANNPVVVRELTRRLTNLPTQACSAAEATQIQNDFQAEIPRIIPLVNKALQALGSLESAWVNNKAALLNGTATLRGEIVCAFRSNFNIDFTDRDYGVAIIKVGRRLRQLQRRLTQPISSVCAPINDRHCLAGAGIDSMAYVVNHQQPVHICKGWRDDPDSLNRRTTLIHEFLHLLPGLGDRGGYALGGLFGAQGTTCQANFKFSANTDLLVNSADSIAGFVLHIDQKATRQSVIIR